MSLFEQILSTNIVNFIIVIATLALIFKKAKLSDIIERLATDIKNNVEKSAANTQSALSEYKTVKKQTKDTPKLQEEIIENAKTNAGNTANQIEKKASDNIEEIKASLEKIYLSQGNKQKSSTINEVSLACINLAQAETISRLNDETHKNLIDTAINDLDKLQGGLN